MLAAVREHVGRDIAAVDVQAGLQQREQEAARATAKVEGGLAVALDEPLVEGQLSRVRFVELGPPARDQAVMPGLRGVRHAALRNEDA